MTSMASLAFRYFKVQKRRTAITVISMLLAIAMVASVGLLISSLRSMLIASKTGNNGVWHYRISLSDASNLTGTRTDWQTMLDSDSIASSGLCDEQTYLRVSDTKNNYYNLKQFDAAAMALMPYAGRITAGRMPENEREIIISNASAAFWPDGDPLGETISLMASRLSEMEIVQTVKGEEASISASNAQPQEYTVVGTFERFRASNAPNISEAATLNPELSTGETLYVQLTERGNFDRSIAHLLSSAGLESETVLEPHSGYLRLIGQGGDMVKYLFGGAFLLLTVIILSVMMIVIKNSYMLSVVEKTEVFGILRCLCATKKQIYAFVFWEGLFTWALSLLPGGLAAFAAMYVIVNQAATLGISALDGLRFAVPVWPFLAAAGATLLTMLLSIIGACIKACAITPVEAFRGNDPYQGKNAVSITKVEMKRGRSMSIRRLLSKRNRQKNASRFRITVSAIGVSVMLFVFFAGAATAVTDFMGRYINKGGMDFVFASSHHVEKSADSYAALRADLAQYPEILAMQEVYPIEYMLNVPESKVRTGYEAVWQQFYPVDIPFMSLPAFAELGARLKSIEVLPVNRENYAMLDLVEGSVDYDSLLASGSVILCQSEVFRDNSIMQVTDFGSFLVGDTISIAQETVDGMQQIRNLSVGAVLNATPWFAPERTHGFVLVPIETIDSYYEQGGNTNNLYTTGMLCIQAAEENLPVMQERLSERAKSAFGALTGYVFNSSYANNQEIVKTVDVINLFVYGFLVLIAIICGLNIFNTIWADLSSRRKEIALLRAIGMGQRQLISYLFSECVQYAVFGAVPGCSLGFLGLYGVVQVMKSYLFIELSSPVQIIFVTIAVTLLIASLAGATPIRRITKAAIIDEIRACD